MIRPVQVNTYTFFAGELFLLSNYARKYFDPLPVVTISPPAIRPREMALVVTRSPSRKLREPLIEPEMVPSRFSLHPFNVGTPRGATFWAAGLGAGFGATFLGTGLDTGLLVTGLDTDFFGVGLDTDFLDAGSEGASPPPKSEKLGRGLDVCAVGAVGLEAGLGEPPPNNEMLGRGAVGLGAGLGGPLPNSEMLGRGAASLGAGLAEDFGAGLGASPPNNDILGRGAAAGLGAGVGAGFGTDFGESLPNKEMLGRGAITGAALGAGSEAALGSLSPPPRPNKEKVDLGVVVDRGSADVAGFAAGLVPPVAAGTLSLKK